MDEELGETGPFSPEEWAALPVLSAIETDQEHQRAVFRLARVIASFPRWRKATRDDLGRMAEAWHNANREAMGKNGSSTSKQFLYECFRKVRYPQGSGVVDLAWARAKRRKKIELPASIAGDQEVAAAAKLCRELADDSAAFFLSCRDVGRMLGVSHEKGAVLLRILVDAGVLTITTDSTRKKARRYRYIG